MLRFVGSVETHSQEAKMMIGGPLHHFRVPGEERSLGRWLLALGHVPELPNKHASGAPRILWILFLFRAVVVEHLLTERPGRFIVRRQILDRGVKRAHIPVEAPSTVVGSAISEGLGIAESNALVSRVGRGGREHPKVELMGHPASC